MDSSAIRYELHNRVGIISLNRPHRMNAVNETMYREIQEVLRNAESDDNIRVIIFTGSVYRKEAEEKQAFCSGADLKEHASEKRDKEQKKKYILLAHETTRMIYEFPKPTIAAINGPARGAGVEMAPNCDLILMADNATIAFSETGLGTFVGGGVTSHLPLIVGLMKAKELIYTGRIIDGKESVQYGIALKSFQIKDLMAEAVILAEKISEKAPISMKLAKTLLRESRLIDLDKVLESETNAILSCMKTKDWIEGVRSFIEKRKPVFRGK